MDVSRRAASMSDSALILSWRNSVSAMEMSQVPTKISQLEHKAWFSTRIKNQAREPFWIMSFHNLPIGYVRLDLAQDRQDVYSISIFVDEQFRGCGFGKHLLKMAIVDLISLESPVEFRAVIKNGNERSHKLFKSFGFRVISKVNSDFIEYAINSSEIRLDALNF